MLLFAVTFGFLLIVLYVLILFIVYSVIVIVACLLCIVTLDSFSRMVFLFGRGLWWLLCWCLVFGDCAFRGVGGWWFRGWFGCRADLCYLECYCL